MKLGLLTDIHEQVEFLRLALARFERERVEQIVVIGDTFETGTRIEETCRLLSEVGAIGVWGNHDFGLCSNPDAATWARYPRSVLDFMTTMKPRLEIAGCHFAHVEPWLDPENVTDLWYFDGPPDNEQKLTRIFGAIPGRHIFAGHFHQWLIATPERILGWLGYNPIILDPGRFFVVIGALCLGRSATFDTESCELVPYND
jgi:predicted phosphodiesterase